MIAVCVVKGTDGTAEAASFAAMRARFFFVLAVERRVFGDGDIGVFEVGFWCSLCQYLLRVVL